MASRAPRNLADAVPVLSRYWTDGNRHAVALAIAGACRQTGVSEQDALGLLEALTSISGGDRADLRAAVRTSYQVASPSGLGELKDLLGETDAKAVLRCLPSTNGHTPPAEVPVEPPAAPLPTEEELAQAHQVLCQNNNAVVLEAREFLRSLGLDVAALGWGIARLRPEELATYQLRREAAGPRLLAPVRNAAGELVDVRRIAARCFPDRPKEYKNLPWSKGRKAATYGWHDAPADGPLVWCEGELDCEVLRAHGLPAVTHTCGVTAAAGLVWSLPKGHVAGREFAVWFDHQAAGGRAGGAVAQAARKLARNLLDHGAAAVRLVTWPERLPDGRETPEGFDVSDWIEAGFGADGLRELLAAAAPYEPPTAKAEHPHCAPGEHRLDDIGNAERLVELFGDRLRYCYDWQTWLVYDGTRWAIDIAGEAIVCAKETARSIIAEAYEADADLRGSTLKWATMTAKRDRLSAMLELAKPELAVQSPQLDADAWLLNCESGTIDLRTGELRDHEPADLISRRVSARYQPEADQADTEAAAEWRRFLAFVTQDDVELQAYLLRAAGYSVTGSTREEVLFFAFGPERTGKSTFLQALEHVLADYAATADFEAFLKSRSGSDAKPEIAKLQGRRFVKSLEVAKGRTFAEELVKTLTGGDTISARALHQNPVEWVPAFKLWMAANDRPNVRHDDGAMWRRLRILPFTHQVPETETDRGLKTRLQTPEATAVILAWLVRGCLEWQADGLGTCEAVQAATAEYRTDMDQLAAWLSECCRLDPQREDWFAATGDLYESYTKWCEANGEPKPLTRKDLGKELVGRGLTADRPRVGGRLTTGYRGVMLPDPDSLDLDDNPASPAEQPALPETAADQGGHPDRSGSVIRVESPLTERNDQGDQGSCRVSQDFSSRRDLYANHPDHPDHPDHPPLGDDEYDPFKTDLSIEEWRELKAELDGPSDTNPSNPHAIGREDD